MSDKKFKNMLDYANETLLTFHELPFNEVDSLILSWLSYLRFQDFDTLKNPQEGISIRDVFRAEDFASMSEGVKSPKETILLLTAIIASPRFRSCRLHYYQHDCNQKSGIQFAAITFALTEELSYIAFRGTDCTLIGWKEDFKLALKDPIPSQLTALSYLTEIVSALPGDFIVGGHSKGGNLAVYAAVHCEPAIQDRITAVYTHDGPGFLSSDLAHPGFAAMKERIHKTVPQSSLFGIIFEPECDYDIVESNEFSVLQHNPLSWTVVDDHLIRRADLTADAKMLQKRLNAWINGISDDNRRAFIDGIFDLLDETKAASFDEFGSDLKNNIPILFRSFASLPRDQQFFMIQTLLTLFTGSESTFLPVPE